MSQRKKTVGKVTHIVAPHGDEGAFEVLNALRSNASTRCERIFPDWEIHQAVCSTAGTIGAQDVTLVVGEFDDPEALIYRVATAKSGEYVKGRAAVGQTKTILHKNLSARQAASIANQLASQLFVHGNVGIAGSGRRRSGSRGGGPIEPEMRIMG